MVGERRFAPVVFALFVVLGVLLARLFQVQVVEHATWAAQAESLVRSSQVLPSHRGSLLDRHGRVLVEDRDVWRVDIVYRDFRREHPLGIVTHARSTLEMRAVPIAEALARLEDWSEELGRLSPRDLDRFARGGALATASLAVPETDEPSADDRASRASDLRFYVGALLRPSRAERAAIRRAEREDPPSEVAYAAIVARERATDERELLAGIRADVAPEGERLGRLAALVPPSRDGAPCTVESILARLEAARERFEFASADALFEEAAGFSPGRLRTPSLLAAFDLRWIATALRWEPERARAWAESRRPERLRDLEELVAPRILARAGLAEDAGEEPAELLLDGLASTYAADGQGGSWREPSDVAVLSEIPTLFDLPRRPSWDGEDGPGLPLFDPDVRALSRAGGEGWLVLGTVAEMAGAELPGTGPGDPAVRNARDWSRHLAAIADRDGKLEGAAARRAFDAILLALEERLAAAADSGLSACLAAAASGDELPGPLTIARDRLAGARQKERFLLKDLSGRPARFLPAAGYPIVQLLARYAARYAGFSVGPATRRVVRARDAQNAPVAAMLLGNVRGPSPREVLQTEDALQRLREGLDSAGAIVLDGENLRLDEQTGSYGVEALFDPELRGRDGWVQVTGLEEERSRGLVRAAVDGKDVELTLDLDLQLAAQETLGSPRLPSDPETDPGWFANPVGAIVLLSIDGEVLAAASEPTRRGLAPAPGRDLERSYVRERTLTKWPFTPPGSVFKPFVAAYAIDRLGLDPETERFECLPLEGGGAGYKTMHCHGAAHGHPDLAEALARSCNATFAMIGERYTPEQMVDMMTTFGFSRPTGIREVGNEDGGPRKGLFEHGRLRHEDELVKNLADAAERRRFANGLGRIEATPMQLARAMAGLVSGTLPHVRIAREVGGLPVEASGERLAISDRAREIVCRDLVAVVDSPAGSAYGKGLDRGTLGFSFACKTGSADKRRKPAEIGGTGERVRGQLEMMKQTWIAGWFPVEDPKAVLVVMLHDTTKTSSHTSVYVAAQFLQSPAVRRFVEGVPPEAAAGTEASAAIEAAARAEDTEEAPR